MEPHRSTAEKRLRQLEATPGALPLGLVTYQKLRERILNGSIEGRTLLRESDLAREYGVSRTPIREALRRLEAEELIAAIPQRGFVVIEHDPEDLENVYTVRAVLEGLAARLAARNRSATDLARLHEIAGQMDVAVGRGDREMLVQLNTEFHVAVTRAGRNVYLERMLSGISEVFDRYRLVALRQPGRVADAFHEHQSILEAIDGSDGDRAESLSRNHVSTALTVRKAESAHHGVDG